MFIISSFSFFFILQLQSILRKKKFDFRNAISITNEVRTQVKKRKELLKLEKNSNNTNNNLNKNDSEAEKIASNGTEVKGNSTDSQENLSNSIKNGQNNGRNMTVDENVAKIGPSEDYDLVKQRLCERKKVIIY